MACFSDKLGGSRKRNSAEKDPKSQSLLDQTVDQKIDQIFHDLSQISVTSKNDAVREHETLAQGQGELLTSLGELAATSPAIWHRTRDKLVRKPELTTLIFTLFQEKFELIWQKLTQNSKFHNYAFNAVLAKFWHSMKKELSEHKERSLMINRLEKSINDNFREKSLSTEAASDLADFIHRVENIWLEVRWSDMTHGAYSVSPIEVCKASLKLIRQYGFGSLPLDIHRQLHQLIRHLITHDSTDYLLNTIKVAFHDEDDLSAWAFDERVRYMAM